MAKRPGTTTTCTAARHSFGTCNSCFAGPNICKWVLASLPSLSHSNELAHSDAAARRCAEPDGLAQPDAFRPAGCRRVLHLYAHHSSDAEVSRMVCEPDAAVQSSCICAIWHPVVHGVMRANFMWCLMRIRRCGAASPSRRWMRMSEFSTSCGGAEAVEVAVAPAPEVGSLFLLLSHWSNARTLPKPTVADKRAAVFDWLRLAL